MTLLSDLSCTWTGAEVTTSALQPQSAFPRGPASSESCNFHAHKVPVSPSSESVLSPLRVPSPQWKVRKRVSNSSGSHLPTCSGRARCAGEGTKSQQRQRLWLGNRSRSNAQPMEEVSRASRCSRKDKRNPVKQSREHLAEG